uniref:Endonuclease/exonuclease/phosphatase domain-containing protein n=1 Tax=Trichogramma kaykai TaxID=54128 RepID=A0ABD2W5T0_9HYME
MVKNKQRPLQRLCPPPPPPPPPRLIDEEFSALLANVTEEAQGKRPLVLAGDFNAWSVEWGCLETRARGTALMDSLAPLDVVILNTGDTPTFVGPNGQSIIDVTFVSDTLAPRTTPWQVSKLYTHSDHQALSFGIRDARPPRRVPLGSCRWNSRSLNEANFTAMMAGAEVTRVPTEEMAAELMSAITGACDASMARSAGRGRHGPVYWWTDGISDLQRACLQACRLAQRARGRRTS